MFELDIPGFGLIKLRHLVSHELRKRIFKRFK